MAIVFMRNVLIYFDVNTKKAILARVRKTMKPDGYFFLGGAESILSLDDALVRVQVDKGAYYQIAAA